MTEKINLMKPTYKVGQVVAVNPYYGGGIMKITEVVGIIDDSKQCFYRGEVHGGAACKSGNIELHAEEDIKETT